MKRLLVKIPGSYFKIAFFFIVVVSSIAMVVGFKALLIAILVVSSLLVFSVTMLAIIYALDKVEMYWDRKRMQWINEMDKDKSECNKK